MRAVVTQPRQTLVIPESTVPETPTKRTPSIDEVVEAIHSDAASRPAEYLDEVQVPHGGE